jgi:hypothetical protein
LNCKHGSVVEVFENFFVDFIISVFVEQFIDVVSFAHHAKSDALGETLSVRISFLHLHIVKSELSVCESDSGFVA